MSLGHWVEVCRHGVIHAQCECFGEKVVRLVPCRPLTEPAWRNCGPEEDPDLSLPDEATIVMDSGVFHEEYR